MSEVIDNAEQTNESAQENTLLTNDVQEPVVEETEATQNESEPTESTETVKREAPESYSFENVEVNKEILDTYSNVAKELNLTQDEASKMLESLAPKFNEVQQREIENMKTSWENETKSDKEIGGDKLNENLSIANKALKSFGSDNLTSLLNETGLGNHPDVIRFFVNVGKSISEDGFVSGKSSQQQKSLAEIMYGNNQ